MIKALKSENEKLSANHQKLIDATIESIAQRGLGETTISHVSSLAGVSQGYAHFRFKSKENLLISSLQYLSNEYMESWSKIFEDKKLAPMDQLSKIIENDFDLSPRGIREMLQLNKPIYEITSAYGHFGRKPTNKGEFTWEKTDKTDLFKL